MVASRPPEKERSMEPNEKTHVLRLIRSQRWAALATHLDGEPFASMVAYVPEPDLSGFLLHLSRLASHTKHLLLNPKASLVISEPDTGGGNPQELARLSIQGVATELARDDPYYTTARDLYIERLPDSEMLFSFADFVLFRLVPDSARYVGGFARARTLSAEELRSLAAG